MNRQTEGASMQRIADPHLLKCGGTLVEIEYSDTKKTIDSQLINYLECIKKNEYAD